MSDRAAWTGKHATVLHARAKHLKAQSFRSVSEMAMARSTAILIVLGLTAALPAWAQTSTSHAPAAAPAPPASAQKVMPAAAPSAVPAAHPAPSAAANQFSSEQAAKAHCPGETVVWVNLGGSKAYHTAGDRYYGKTKHGAFMCQKEAETAGFHAPGHRPVAARGSAAKPK